MSALPVPYQLLAAAAAGLIVSSLCILAAMGALVLLNILLPDKNDKKEKTK